MRVIITLFFFLSIFISSQAQYDKGKKLIGGTIAFSSNKNLTETPGNDRTSSFGISPSAGIFYQKNRLAGVNLQFGLNSYEDWPNGHTIGGGVFLRQYVQLGKSAFSFFGHESANVGIGRFSRSSVPGTFYRMKSTNVNVAVAPAFAYGPTKRLQVELRFPQLLTLSYERQKPVAAPNPDANNVSNFAFESGFEDFSGFGVGVSLLL